MGDTMFNIMRYINDTDFQIVYINNELNVLNGFLVKDEYNNIIIQYVINVQKDETYKTNILNIINCFIQILLFFDFDSPS